VQKSSPLPLDAVNPKILQKSDKTIVVVFHVSSSLYPVRQNLSFSCRTGVENGLWQLETVTGAPSIAGNL
jgi:hypothetical protein